MSPGLFSKAMYLAILGFCTILRAICMPATVVSRSVWADRKFGRMAGSVPGVDDLMWIEPRESGRHWPITTVMPGSFSSMRFCAES